MHKTTISPLGNLSEDSPYFNLNFDPNSPQVPEYTCKDAADCNAKAGEEEFKGRNFVCSSADSCFFPATWKFTQPSPNGDYYLDVELSSLDAGAGYYKLNLSLFAENHYLLG